MKKVFMNILLVLVVANLIIINNIKPTYAINVVKDDDTKTSIPIGYHFAPRYIEDKTKVTLSNAPSGYEWVAVSTVDYYQLRTLDGQLIMPPDSYKGKMWVKYTNVGFYNGDWLDMKITILDWNSYCKRVEFGRTRIGVGNASSDRGGIDGWMNVRIDYYHAGTDILYSGLKGHQPVGDMDYWKGTGKAEWLKTGNNNSIKIIIPSSDYDKFDLSKISSNMIGVKSSAGGGTKNNDGVDFVYLFETPSQTLTWYGGFLGMNMTCPIKEYQVNYMPNDGTGNMSSIVVGYEESKQLAANAFTKKGYHFDGWHVYREYDDSWFVESSWKNKPDNDSKYTHYLDKSTISKMIACGNVYLYACFDPNKHVISYNANGGSNAPENQTKIYGNSMKISSKIPVREGYDFKYWTTMSYDLGGRNQVVQYYNTPYIKRGWLNILDSKTIEVFIQADDTASVEIAVWTSKDGQDDRVWHSLSKGSWNRNGESFNYGTKISIDSHNGEVGEYIHHVYAYNDNHNPLSMVSLQPRGFIYNPGDIYEGYQNGGTQVLYAQWIKSDNPPEIYARENYYYKDSVVNIDEVVKNANAYDQKDGDISDKIYVLKAEYPDGSIVDEPAVLNTSLLGRVEITYKVFNSSHKSSEIKEVVYIVNKGIDHSIYNDSKIYSRFISKSHLDDGVNALDTLNRDSIWLTDDYNEILRLSLDNLNYLQEFDYINKKEYINTLKGSS